MNAYAVQGRLLTVRDNTQCQLGAVLFEMFNRKTIKPTITRQNLPKPPVEDSEAPRSPPTPPLENASRQSCSMTVTMLAPRLSMRISGIFKPERYK